MSFRLTSFQTGLRHPGARTVWFGPDPAPVTIARHQVSQSHWRWGRRRPRGGSHHQATRQFTLEIPLLPFSLQNIPFPWCYLGSPLPLCLCLSPLFKENTFPHFTHNSHHPPMHPRPLTAQAASLKLRSGSTLRSLRVPTKASLSQCLLNKQDLHKGICKPLVMGIEISLSHCISIYLGVRVTAVMFLVLHLFHTSKVFRSTGRGRNMCTKIIFHFLS